MNKKRMMKDAKRHIMVVGDDWRRISIRHAMTCHYPEYELDCRNRTRITVVVETHKDVHDFVFSYQELFDNCYWRSVDLNGERPRLETHRPQYEGSRKDFVDVEWEFVIGYLTNPIIQEKIRRWAKNPKQRLTISICYDDIEKNHSIGGNLKRRLPDSLKLEMEERNPEAEAVENALIKELSKYIHYVYRVCYEQKRVPTELPEEDVEWAWAAIKDEKQKMANIYNVMSIPVKMEILGHDRDDWGTLYALTAEEIGQLTAVEHNRWSVERLIQGMRPCTDQEREEIEADLCRRLTDEDYAVANPVSLKQIYKQERNAHYDLCAFTDLGVDETGLPVSRYDRDLTAAIPLIVKTYNDRHGNG